MKALRILYMMIIYTMAIPLMMVFVTGVFIFITIESIRNDGKPHFKDTIKGVVDGTIMGHKYSMTWVKYGNNYGIEDLIDEEEL